MHRTMVSRCCFVLVFLTCIVGVTTLQRCRDCDYRGESYTSLTVFGVQLSKCHFQRCFCRCSGSVNCPLSQRRVTCKDECIMCRNPFTGNQLPPFTTFRHRSRTLGLLNCECGCHGSYSCTSAYG
ncbi:uncharacterized protein LOC125661538 [Ostrea edulis]|uniref:uncharacterized protein LOC125661538 n=1 Tax=Ostrea edulis TaxID=37623 RepID=UPI0020949139|nr:uncharacterized protein LOC125661538 [Ostrea edulis]